MSQAFDDLVQRMDDADQAQQDFADSLDTSLSDIGNTIDEQAQAVETLNESAGQLQFPLTQDTIDLIKEIFPTGVITLVGGTATLIDPRISTTSTILFNIITPHVPTVAISSTPFTLTPLYYYVTITNGQAVFYSSSAGDTSILNYLLIP